MAHLALRCLGGFEVRVVFGSPVDFPTRKAKALLAYLARHPGRRASRDRIGALLWERCDDERARINLRQTLMLVRKTLSHACVVSEGDALYLDPDEVAVDVAEFDQRCREASADALERAAALYQGQFLEGFVLDEEPYEDWLRTERENLEERAIEALMTLLRWHLAAGRADHGVRVAKRVLALDPLRETAHRALMRLYADMGDRALALKQYQSCTDVLDAELGVQPEMATRRLCEEIRHEHRAVDVDRHGLVEAERGECPPLPDKPSIAVLPFLNLSGDAAQAYFSDGITSDIITELARFRSTFVIARHSSFAYRDKAVPVQRIGRELGVHYVVEGSISKVGCRIRVNAELVDAQTGHDLWADRYDRSLAEIFAFQDELVRTIVSTLDRRIDLAGRARTATMSDSTLRAYDLYLRAAAAQDRNTKADYQCAKECLERALVLDPNLAQAHHHLSLVKFFLWMERWVENLDRVFAEAFDAARAALARDDTDSMVQAHLGMLHMYRREFDQAGLRFAEAIRLNPNDSRALGLYGLFLAAVGRAEEAIAQFEQAERLNPLRPGWLNRLKGIACFSAARYADAITAFKASGGAINQERGWLAASCAQAGRLDEARGHLQDFLRVAREEMAVLPAPTVGAWRSCWRPIEYQHERDFDRLFDGLRKAGLPD